MGVPRRFAAKRDANESSLFRVARQMGARVKISGPLDAWVHTRQLGWFPVEVKNPEGKNKYTADQVDFLEWCRAWKMPVETWRYASDVIKTLNGEASWNTSMKKQQKKSSKDCAKEMPNGSESAVMIADACL
jgi:hypothetical protein